MNNFSFLARRTLNWCGRLWTRRLNGVRNRDDWQRDFNAPPVIVNFFFHEQIKKTPTNFGGEVLE